MKPIPEMTDIDSEYECVLNDPPPETTLKSSTWTWTIHGRHITIPSRRLFVADDGSVYIVTKRKGNKSEYASLKSLIETVKNTVIIEGFSCPAQT